MRRTVTLDKDVERMLRQAMYRSRTGFKQTLNAAIRAGLKQKTASETLRRFVLKARPLGLRTELDMGGFNKLADELEAEAVLIKGRKQRAK